MKIPPHLQIAESVTEEEYQRAMWQSKLQLAIALSVGVISCFLMIMKMGIFMAIMCSGVTSVAIERGLHLIFKDAHKARTQRIQRYKELKAYRDFMHKQKSLIALRHHLKILAEKCPRACIT